jgi:hypothetical protein
MLPVREKASELAGEIAEWSVYIGGVSALIGLLLSIFSSQPFISLLMKSGMLVSMLVALSGAFSYLGLSNVFLERQVRIGLTDAEREGVSFVGLVRIVSGIGMFFIFLFFS